MSKKNRQKFIKLSKRVNKDHIRKLKVTIAPSREDANPIILREHTINASKKWSPVMQAEFYVRQIKNGMSISDMQEDFNVTPGQIGGFLKLHNMYSIACNLSPLEDKIKDKVNEKKSFPASTLERVYGYDNLKEFLGIEFTENGDVTGTVKKGEFELAYSKIITDIIEGNISSRKHLATEKDAKKYIDGPLKKYKPSSNGSFTQSDFSLEDKQDLSVEEETAPPPQPRSTRKSQGIIPSGIPFKLKGTTNLQLIYRELKKVSVKSYPNTSAVTLRVFLDKSIRMYLKKKGIEIIQVIDHKQPVDIKVEDATLGELIDHLVKKDVKIIDNRNVKSVLKKFKSSDTRISLSALNSLVHNEEYALNEDDVRDIWAKLEGLFRIILIEP